MPGLFLDVYGALTLVEFDYAVPFRLLYVAGENQSSIYVPSRPFDHIGQVAAVEEVVAEYQCAGIIPDERLADQKGLGYPLRRGLHGILETYPQVASRHRKACGKGRYGQGRI